MNFEKNVFINCPFDNEYFPILKAILFTTIFLDLEPKISETSDSGINRLTKLKQLISESKFSIHDISRIQVNDKGFPRFNMPFECGIDFGCKMFGSVNSNQKVSLILESKKYVYQEFMSDIAGNDIRVHDNNPEKAIKMVRDWLQLNTKRKLDYAFDIYKIYREFENDYIDILSKDHFNPNEISAITFTDIILIMKEWISGWRERK